MQSVHMRTVIVIGGGFAGWALINQLQNSYPKRTQIILIDNKEFFESTPAVYEYLTLKAQDDRDRSHIHFQHSEHVNSNTQVICGDVIEVTNEDVAIVQHFHGKAKENARLRYDCLVVCSGRKYQRMNLDDRTLLERMKNLRMQRNEIKRSETLLVIGGGAAGIEIACDLACRYKDKSVTMMHRGARLLPRACNETSAYLDTALKAKRVHIVYNHHSNISDRPITSSLPTKLELSAKINIYDKVIRCVGGTPNTDFMETHFASHLEDSGAIKVNSFFQLEGFPNIFAIGDVTAIPEEKTAERAMVHGELVANYIRRLLKRKIVGNQGYAPLRVPFMQAISIGPSDGVALISGTLVHTGFEVAKMKQEFAKAATANLTRKLVINKRYSLYGLISKTRPIQASTRIEVEPMPISETTARKSGIFCCFTAAAAEPQLSFTSPASSSTPFSTMPPRRALRTMTGAVGMLDFPELEVYDDLNPKALILGGDSGIAKLLIEALAHTGMRTRAAMHEHTWITASASLKLSYSMLVNHVECMEYKSTDGDSLDKLLEGIQVVLLPVGIDKPPELQLLLTKLSNCKTLKCVVYVRLISEDRCTYLEIEDMLRAQSLPCVIVRHSVTMQSVRDIIAKQVQSFRAIAWPDKGANLHLLDQKDLCTSLAMIFYEPKRHVGKVYHLVGPERVNGADMARFLSNQIGEDLIFFEVSNDCSIKYMLTQGYSRLQAEHWVNTICSPPIEPRSSELDTIIDGKPSTFAKWLESNILSFCDVHTRVVPSLPSSSNTKPKRPRSTISKNSKTEAPTLHEVLDDKVLSRKFLEFLQSEFCAENYLFWFSVERFRDIIDTDEMIATAEKISNQYIYEGGTNPINIDQKLRIAILSNMRMGLSRDIFDIAQSKVLRLMEMEAFPRFAKMAGLLPKNTKLFLKTRSSSHAEPLFRQN